MTTWPLWVVFLLLVSVVWASCVGGEAYYIPDGRDYRGDVGVSASGLPCQPWTSVMETVDATLGLGAHRLCRNPFGTLHPGCFTTDVGSPFQLCDVGPVCLEKRPVPSPRLEITPIPYTNVKVGDALLFRCYPHPCAVYAAFDADAVPDDPSQAVAQAIAVPPRPEGVVAVSIAGVFEGGVVLRRFFSYNVSGSRDGGRIGIYPTPAGVYRAPVLVTLSPPSQVVPWVELTSFVGTETFWYTEPFWIYGTTTVLAATATAVRRETYNIRPPQIAPRIFPLGGRFVGGVRVLFLPRRLETLFYRFGDGAWMKLNGTSLNLTSRGQVSLSFFSRSIINGDSTVITGVYDITEPLLPWCLPPPGNFTTNIGIRCESPLPGRDLFQCIGDDCRLFSGLPRQLQGPGVFNVSAFYYDDAQRPVIVGMVYRITARNLGAPAMVPCGGAFTSPLVLRVGPSVAGARVALAFDESVTVTAASEGVVIVNLRTASANVILVSRYLTDSPMLAPSGNVTCAFALFKAGRASTPWLRVTLVGWQLNAFANAVSDALFLPDISTVEIAAVGIYTLARITTIDTSLTMPYLRRLWNTLAGLSNVTSLHSPLAFIPPDRMEPFNATTASACARNCKYFALSDGSCQCSTNPAIFISTAPYTLVSSYDVSEFPKKLGSGPLRLTLNGTNVELLQSVRVIEASLPCSDGGYLIVVSGGWLNFSPIFPGDYALCVDMGDGPQRVPASTPTNQFTVVPAFIADVPEVHPCGVSLTGQTRVEIVSSGNSVLSLNGGPWVVGSSVVVSAPSTLAVGALFGDGRVTTQRICRYWSTASTDVSSYDFASLGDAVQISLTGVFDGSIVAVELFNSYEETTTPCDGSPMWSSIAVGNDTRRSTLQRVPFSLLNHTPSEVCVQINDLRAYRVLPASLHLSRLSVEVTTCTPCPSGLCVGTHCACRQGAELQWCGEVPHPPNVPDVALSPTGKVILVVVILVSVAVVISVAAQAVVMLRRNEEKSNSQ